MGCLELVFEVALCASRKVVGANEFKSSFTKNLRHYAVLKILPYAEFLGKLMDDIQRYVRGKEAQANKHKTH